MLPTDDYGFDETEEAQKEFRAGFRRNRKGNLQREYGGLTLTVFRWGEGYRWCMSDDDYGPQYSHDYESEEEAVFDLWLGLEG
jgi:hypothetical protein